MVMEFALKAVVRRVRKCQNLLPQNKVHHLVICVGIGVYISRIEEASVAERAGLRPGDTILEVNGTPFSGMTHEEALTVNDMSFAFL